MQILFLEEHDGFKRQVKENQFGVHILFDVAFGQLEFLHECHDVLVVDEGGEFRWKTPVRQGPGNSAPIV